MIDLDASDETTMVDIEGQAYDLLLEYMKSKANMQVR